MKECCVEASQLGHGRAAWSLAGAYSPATVNGLELSEEQLYALAKQLSEKWLESEPTDKDSWTVLCQLGGGIVHNRAFTCHECYANV